MRLRVVSDYCFWHLFSSSSGMLHRFNPFNALGRGCVSRNDGAPPSRAGRARVPRGRSVVVGSTAPGAPVLPLPLILPYGPGCCEGVVIRGLLRIWCACGSAPSHTRPGTGSSQYPKKGGSTDAATVAWHDPRAHRAITISTSSLHDRAAHAPAARPGSIVDRHGFDPEHPARERARCYCSCHRERRRPLNQ